jgi:AcrR family transcriptional regulator
MATTNTHLDHETRLNQILTASRELIAAGGVGALTIRAIARKVGVTEAAIYRHVDSKDHVLVLLLEDVRQSVLGTIEEATAPHANALDKLEHVLQHHLSFIESRRGISFVVIAEAAQFQEQSVRNAGRKLVEDYLKVVEGFIREGIDSGKVNPAINPSAAAMIFFGMVQASVTRWLFDSSAHPLSENVLSLWKLYRASLMAPGSVESAPKSQ